MSEKGMYRIIFQIVVRDKSGNVATGYIPGFVTLDETQREAWEDYIYRSGVRPDDVDRIKAEAMKDAFEEGILKIKATPVRVEDDGPDYPY